MQLRQRSEEEAKQQFLEALGGDPTSEAGLAELLRRETLAWGVGARHLILRRVAELAGVNRDQCESVLDALARVGDVLEGERGKLAAAPVRVIALPGGGWVVLGSVATRTLQEALGEKVKMTLPRRLSDRIAPEQMKGIAEALGGRVVALERWAGEAPNWQEWLTELRSRKALAGSSAEPWDARESTVFQPPMREEKGSPWKIGAPSSEGSLVRGKSEAGYDCFGWAWVEGGQTKHVRLTRDEAWRSAHALAAEAGRPLRAQVSREAPGCRVRFFGERLPGTEFRALKLMELSEPGADQAPRGGFLVEETAWSGLAEMLKRRLGLSVELTK